MSLELETGEMIKILRKVLLNAMEAIKIDMPDIALNK